MNQSLTDDQVMQQVMLPMMDGGQLVGLLVPVTLFIALATVFGLYYYFRYKTRKDLQATVQTVVEKGQELTPELLERLGQPAKPAKSDLRRGVTLMATGLAIGVFGLTIGEPDAVRPLLAFGLFPFILGLAFMGLWYFGGKERN